MTDPELVARVEAAALWAWPPRETAFVEGWHLRAADGHTRRANSVRTASFTAEASLAAAVAKVEAWYGARGLAACFQLTALSAPAGLDAALAARGYRRLGDTLVLLVDPAGVAPAAAAPVEFATRPTPLVMNAICDRYWDLRTRGLRAELLGRIRKPHVFAVATEGGAPAAGGLCVVDGALAGIFALRAQPPFQRRGHARAVVGHLVAWARRHGAAQAYLQVEEDNAPARALFDRLGGEVAYRYWYREPEPAG